MTRIPRWAASTGMTPVPDSQLPTFRLPRIVSPFPLDPKECECSWVYAPYYSQVPGSPFVIKVPYRYCRLHGRIYYPYV